MNDKNLPELEPGWKMLATWRDGEGVVALAEKEEKVRLYLWDRISKGWMSFYEFEKYQPN
jgi:hypothetical protein